MKYKITYYNCSNDSVFSIPNFSHSEIVDCADNEKLTEYIESKTDNSGDNYSILKTRFLGFDYISCRGAVKVEKYYIISKLEELIDGQLFAQYPSDVQQLEQMMKEYAEWYLEQFKQTTLDNFSVPEYGANFITENGFLSVPNPPHK